MVDFGPELSGDPHCTITHRIHVEKGSIWARPYQISNFRGNTNVAGPHVLRNFGARKIRYRPKWESAHWLIRDFPAVQLRLKSVTEMVGFGPQTSWRSPVYAPAIESMSKKGAIWCPEFPNFQISGKCLPIVPHVVRNVGVHEK